MKPLLITLAIAFVLLGGGYWVKINYFEAGAWAVTGSQDVDAAYRLNTKGNDLRVYEFTPQGDRNSLCVAVAGERNSMLECFPKPRTRD